MYSSFPLWRRWAEWVAFCRVKINTSAVAGSESWSLDLELGLSIPARLRRDSKRRLHDTACNVQSRVAIALAGSIYDSY